MYRFFQIIYLEVELNAVILFNSLFFLIFFIIFVFTRYFQLFLNMHLNSINELHH